MWASRVLEVSAAPSGVDAHPLWCLSGITSLGSELANRSEALVSHTIKTVALENRRTKHSSDKVLMLQV